VHCQRGNKVLLLCLHAFRRLCAYRLRLPEYGALGQRATINSSVTRKVHGLTGSRSPGFQELAGGYCTLCAWEQEVG